MRRVTKLLSLLSAVLAIVALTALVSNTATASTFTWEGTWRRPAEPERGTPRIRIGTTSAATLPGPITAMPTPGPRNDHALRHSYREFAQLYRKRLQHYRKPIEADQHGRERLMQYGHDHDRLLHRQLYFTAATLTVGGGTGTLKFMGSGTYTGGTVINGGTLLVGVSGGIGGGATGQLRRHAERWNFRRRYQRHDDDQLRRDYDRQR